MNTSNLMIFFSHWGFLIILIHSYGGTYTWNSHRNTGRKVSTHTTVKHDGSRLVIFMTGTRKCFTWFSFICSQIYFWLCRDLESESCPKNKQNNSLQDSKIPQVWDSWRNFLNNVFKPRNEMKPKILWTFVHIFTILVLNSLS